MTFTGAEGLSARRESRAFMEAKSQPRAGDRARARRGMGKDLAQGSGMWFWVWDLEIAGTPCPNYQWDSRRSLLRI